MVLDKVIQCPLSFLSSGMEYLSRMLKCASRDSSFKFHPRCALLKHIHLIFAVDLMLFSKGDATSISILYKGLELFSQSSGLHANASKSAIYFAGMPINHQHQILECVNLVNGTLSFRYLSVPLNSISLTIADCSIWRKR